MSMLAPVCFFSFALLTLRSLVLLFAERKRALLRLVDLLAAIVFGGCAALLYVSLGARLPGSFGESLLPLLAVTIPLALLVALRLRGHHQTRLPVLAAKAVLVLLLVCASLVVLMVSGYQFLTEDSPVLKVRIVGTRKSEVVEWKNPGGPLRREALPVQEVHLETPGGQPVARISVYGDQIALKAQVLRFRPWLNAVGMKNLCRIAFAHNGYTTAERHNLLPHQAWPVPTTAHPRLAPLQESFWSFWEHLYHGEGEQPLVKAATLESSFLPLVRPDGTRAQGTYLITVTTGGLSSLPVL